MVTLQNADNALKTFYLDAVKEQIDCKISPFLSMIEKTSAYVTGKGVTKVVRTGVNGGIAAGTETGELPVARGNEYCVLNTTLKNLYGTIEITDKAIRASANDEGAVVNLLNEEMKGLIKSAKHNFSRMLFSDGSGKIGTVVTSGTDGEITLSNVRGLDEGMYVNFYNSGVLVAENKKILTVDLARKKIKVELASEETLDVSNTYAMIAGTPENCELTGLGAIFSRNPLYGLERNTTLMRTYIQQTVGSINESIIQKAIDSIEEQSGGKINLIICSRGVRRALVKYCRDNQIALPSIKIGEDNAISFNGIPVVVDDFCPSGTMYLINVDDFKLCQLCDWQWMEGEDGKILKQVAGKPVYTATLVKYADLICERPCGQGMLSGITEA